MSIPAWLLHPVAWQFLFVLGAGARYYSDHARKLALSRAIIWTAAAIVAASVVLKSLTFRCIAPLLPAALEGISGLNVGQDHLAFYRLLDFLALLVLVHAWTRVNPRHRTDHLRPVFTMRNGVVAARAHASACGGLSRACSQIQSSAE
jgi:hypothetical protein